MSRAEWVAKQLDPDKAKKSGQEWKCRCPVHDDSTPSLFFKDVPGRLNPVFICRAGCDGADIIRELAKRNLWDRSGFDGQEREAWQAEQDENRRQYEALLAQLNAQENATEAVLAYLNDEPIPYKPATHQQLMQYAASLPEREWLLGPIPLGSVGIVAAPPGVGKSMLVLGMVMSAALGRPMGPWEVPKPRKTLIIDVELDTLEMAERVKEYPITEQAYFDWEDWRRKYGISSFELGNDEHHRLLIETVKNLDSDVVVVDNVTFCLQPIRPGEIFNPETWAQVQPLMAWFRAHNKTLILVDHTNKGGTVAGTANKTRSADWIITLEGEPFPEPGVLEFSLQFDKYRFKKSGRLTDPKMVMYRQGIWTLNDIPTQLDEFIEMKDYGHAKDHIMKEMGISKATYYRMQKRYEKRMQSQSHSPPQ